MFRDRERGDLHLPEFTMLEWYRAGAPYDAIMADTVVVIAHAAQATGIGHVRLPRPDCDPFAEPELLTVAGAFERFAGIDLLSTISGSEGDRAALAEAARGKVRVADDDTWSDIFSKVLVEHVEPQSGAGAFDHSVRIPISRGGAGAGEGGRSHGSPNGSRSMPAASSSPTALAN